MWFLWENIEINFWLKNLDNRPYTNNQISQIIFWVIKLVKYFLTMNTLVNYGCQFNLNSYEWLIIQNTYNWTLLILGESLLFTSILTGTRWFNEMNNEFSLLINLDDETKKKQSIEKQKQQFLYLQKAKNLWIKAISGLP